MLLNSILLSFASNIDAFGIGITYGFRKVKIPVTSQIILFLISFFVALFSILFGNIFKSILPDFIKSKLGCIVLIFIGTFILFKSFANSKNFYNTSDYYDLDNSKYINQKEALILALTLSLDCIGIGICSSILNITPLLFALCISQFQLILLNLGIFLGNKISKFYSLPDNIYSIISALILIFIGILDFFID